MCETLPFFAQKRLVIMENTGFLKSSNDELADYIKHIPDYLVVVMVEKDVDKRNKVYKAVDSVGYICAVSYTHLDVYKRQDYGRQSFSC